MTDEQNIAYVLSQTAVLNAKIAGMVAENQAWMIRYPDQTPVYTENDFNRAVEDSGLYHNGVIHMLTGH